MFVSAVNSLRGGVPVKKTEKTAKVSRRAAADGDSEVHNATPPQAQNANAGGDDRDAPKSPAAMSSSAVQAALTFLKAGS
jgi:hypothetical protein